jgi:hypothetical protein
MSSARPHKPAMAPKRAVVPVACALLLLLASSALAADAAENAEKWGFGDVVKAAQGGAAKVLDGAARIAPGAAKQVRSLRAAVGLS